MEDEDAVTQARSAERRRRVQRLERRRRWLPWILCPLVIPALGAAAFVDALGDEPAETWLLLAGFLVPAALSALVGRRGGPVEALLWAAVTLAAQVALVFGVAFVWLDLGPD